MEGEGGVRVSCPVVHGCGGLLSLLSLDSVFIHNLYIFLIPISLFF